MTDQHPDLASSTSNPAYHVVRNLQRARVKRPDNPDMFSRIYILGEPASFYCSLEPVYDPTTPQRLNALRYIPWHNVLKRILVIASRQGIGMSLFWLNKVPGLLQYLRLLQFPGLAIADR